MTGMRVAQANLAVTGHNIANAEIQGFSRQRIVQFDTRPRSIGNNMAGQQLRVGTGVDHFAVQQIRSRYFDWMYRQHNARLHFHSAKVFIGEQIQGILGEPEGAFRIATALSDLWDSIHELDGNIGGIETREFFIGTSISFLTKAQSITNQLIDYQRNLDAQIRLKVGDINNIVSQIHNLNEIIQRREMNGWENANDYRDERNRLMDTLSGLVPVEFFENPETGVVNIHTVNGNHFLHAGSQNFLGLREINGRYGFVEPVFTNRTDVIPADVDPNTFVGLFDWNRPINAARGNDQGSLFAMMQARGSSPLTYRGAEGFWQPVDINGTSILDILNGGGFADIDDIHDTLFGPPPVLADFYVGGVVVPGGERQLVNGLSYELTVMIRDNNIWQFGKHFPLSVTNPGDFLNLVNTQAPVADHRQHVAGLYRAAARSYRSYEWSQEHGLIPRLLMQIDQIANTVVRLINNKIAPVDPLNQELAADAPFDLNGNRSGTEVFTRIGMHRFPDICPTTGLRRDGIHNPGMAGNFDSLFTLRNMEVNPILSQRDGYNLLAFSLSGYRDDDRLIREILATWADDTNEDYTIEMTIVNPDGTRTTGRFSIERAYEIAVIQLAQELNESQGKVDTAFTQTLYADNRRNSVMGVNMDEELSNMMTFLFAYQAASRLFNIVDDMMNTLINRTGRVGL